MDWTGYLVQLLVMLVVHVEGGVLECICTTSDCKERKIVTCQAKAFCYVQYFANTLDDIGKDMIRGCIDSKSPLLCDNRRPKINRDDVEWPVLHCCTSQFCNRDVVPTAPPWLDKRKEIPRKNRTQAAPVYRNESGERGGWTMKHQNQTQMSLNPIYIGVPIAGGCVLLAIILFVIFLFRRNNSANFQRNYDAANHKCALEPDSHLKFGANCNGHNNNHQERTPANSECKLLMKV